jgi:lysophospholipase L1-like esterase
LPNWEQLFIDGLHPTTKGHEWMFEQIRPELLKLVNNT